jgi:hypothetical protein
MADGRLFVSSDAESDEENTTRNLESKPANNINVVKYLIVLLKKESSDGQVLLRISKY